MYTHVVIYNQNSLSLPFFDAMYILNVCCIVTPVSRGLSARHMPTYQRPTSYYCLVGETASPTSNASFSPDGLIVNIQKMN